MLIVVKYGGNAMGELGAGDPVLADLVARFLAGDELVVVHGGGPQIDAALSERGIVTERIAGQRVTSEATLAITEAVLCGTVNKALVRALLRLGATAVGISGQDGALLQAVPLQAELGRVGRIVKVNVRPVRALLEAGLLPVVAPLGYDLAAGAGLNVNADTAAGALAGALQAGAYINLTNVDRVRRKYADPSSATASLTKAEVLAGLAGSAFGGGMQPKLESALIALESGARRAVVAGAANQAISAALAGDAGTEIVL